MQLPAWATRDTVILLGSQWVSQIGNALFAVALYWDVLATTHSRLLLGMAGTGVGLANVLGLVGGVFADRWNLKRTMVVSDLGRGAIALAIALAAFSRALDPATLIAAALALGVVGAAFVPALTAATAELASPKDLPAIYGVQRGSYYAALVLGNGMAGIIIGTLAAAGAFGLDGISFLVSAIALMGLRLRRAAKHQRSESGSGFIQELVEGQRRLWRSPELARLVVLTVLLVLATSAMDVLMAAWVHDKLHRGAVLYGAMNAAEVAGAIAGTFLAAWAMQHVSALKVATAATALGGLAIAAISRWPSPLPDLLLFLVSGNVSGVIGPATGRAMSGVVEPWMRGRVSGTLIALQAAAAPIGIALAGILGAGVPVARVFLLCGVAVCLAVALVMASQLFRRTHPVGAASGA